MKDLTLKKETGTRDLQAATKRRPARDTRQGDAGLPSFAARLLEMRRVHWPVELTFPKRHD